MCVSGSLQTSCRRVAYEECLLPGFEALMVEEQRALSGEDDRQVELETRLLSMILDDSLREQIKYKLARADTGAHKVTARGGEQAGQAARGAAGACPRQAPA